MPGVETFAGVLGQNSTKRPTNRASAISRNEWRDPNDASLTLKHLKYASKHGECFFLCLHTQHTRMRMFTHGETEKLNGNYGKCNTVIYKLEIYKQININHSNLDEAHALVVVAEVVILDQVVAVVVVHVEGVSSVALLVVVSSVAVLLAVSLNGGPPGGPRGCKSKQWRWPPWWWPTRWW